MSSTADESLRYRDAGVDIDVADTLVRRFAALAATTHDERVPRGLGHFGGFFRLGESAPGTLLVASIDGVGTKLKVASLAGMHQWVGEDIVNHCVNDLLACGATPLFFLDYFGTGKLDPEVAVTIVAGIARACAHNGVALIGGETAEMPGVYAPGDYDLVGAIVGVVDEGRIVDGRSVQPGDILLGLPSNGFHTNGYSLIRAALRLNDDDASRQRLREPAPFDPSRTLGEVLLQPHRSYIEPVRRVLAAGHARAMAHITGGGLPGNVVRVLPAGVAAEIDVAAWEVPPAFTYVAEAGHVAPDECYRAFNMGIGYVIVCAPEHVAAIQALVPDAVRIGTVVPTRGDQRVVLRNLDPAGP